MVESIDSTNALIAAIVASLLAFLTTLVGLIFGEIRERRRERLLAELEKIKAAERETIRLEVERVKNDLSKNNGAILAAVGEGTAAAKNSYQEANDVNGKIAKLHGDVQRIARLVEGKSAQDRPD